MALSTAHTSIKETIGVAVTGISGSGRSSGGSLTNKNCTNFNRDNFNLYLRDAVSAVLATATCMAGWLSVTHAGIV